MTKIVFMGTPPFSVPILEMLAEEYDVQAVVTQPDRPVGRKRVLTPPAVKVAAEKLNIPVLQPEKLSDSEELKQVLELQPDIVVTAAFGQLLPNELLEAPPLGCINVHASLLPAYRGGAPIHQAVIDGAKETGITIMYMAEKLDAGDIIRQRAIPIEHDDDTGKLFEELSLVGRDLLKETMPSIIDGTNERIPQNEEEVTYAWNISREDERIDWTKGGEAIRNHIRGLHPWPTAYTTFDGERVKVWWAELEEGRSGTPGEIVEIREDGVIVASGDATALRLTDVQPAGKRRMEIEQFVRGTNWKVGDRFE